MFILDGKTLPIDTPFEHDGLQYPANWLRLSTLEEKTAIGITEVPDPVRPDDRFYWVSGDGTSTPKSLDILKPTWENIVNQTAYSLLLPSDWMVVRKTEAGTDIPAEWATYRAAVRTAALNNRTALMNAADFNAFVTVATSLQWPQNPNAPQEANNGA